MSPLLFASAVGDATDHELGGISSRRDVALGNATSLGEIVHYIPLDYRPILRPLLVAATSDAERRADVREQVAKLEKHKAAGTLPPSLAAVKPPSFQLSKAFVDTTPEVSTTNDLKQLTKTYVEKCLDAMIEGKRAELAFVEKKLDSKSLIQAGLDSLNDHWTNVIAPKTKVPVWGSETLDDGSKRTVMTGEWSISEPLRKQVERLAHGLPRLFYATILLVENREIVAKQKAEAKEKIKNAADVEMGDDTTQVDALKNELQDLRKSFNRLALDSVRTHSLPLPLPPSSTRPAGTRAGSSVLNANSESSSAQKRPREEDGQEHRLPRRRRLNRQEGLLVQGFFVEEEVGCDTGVRAEGSRTASQGRQDGTQGQGSRDELIEFVRSSPWRYDHPHSYPDEILLIDTPTAIRLLLERVAPSVREAARFRARVFTGPGVLLPRHLAIHLSSSMRYMMYTPPSAKLIYDAWNDFKDRLRWRVYFETLKAKGEDEEKPYDPDYEVPHKRKPFNKGTPAYIELGLQRGDEFITKFCKDVMPTVIDPSRRFNLVWLPELKSYLNDHEYLVTQTDKNLGLAVITKQWFIEHTTKLWNDPLNYRKITPAERQMSLERSRAIAIELSELADALDHDQLAKFLRSKVPESEHEESVVPVFYGIPKMHKLPVKMRPIVPCHSNAQAPAAVLVAKMLAPLVEAQPYVLRGSKDLAVKLSTLKLSPYRKAWIVSGDIVAYYPNIPLSKCLGIVGNWWLHTEGQKYSQEWQHLFVRCFQFANKGLIIDFNGETAEQIRGLAMGIACSPQLANLYGAKFENVIMEEQIMKDRVPFYGRYLDDVLAIVYAESSDEALAIAKRIEFKDVEVEWSASEWHTPFLDMFVYIDPASRQLEHKPYRKPLNHRERIPWASHHPKDVKKGTFIGEMSRMAVLSSRIEHYSEAVADLRSLYVSRGYPFDLVRKWAKDNYGKRWNDRLTGPKSSSGEVFVLKTHFNPAWSAFNVHELGKVVTESWLSSLHKYDYAEQQREVSRRVHRVSLSPAPQEGHGDAPSSATPSPKPLGGDTVQRTLSDIWAGRVWRTGEAGPSGLASGSRAQPTADQAEEGMDDMRAIEADNMSNPAQSVPASDLGSGIRTPSSPVGSPVLPDGHAGDPKGPLITTGSLLPVGHSNALELESVLDLRFGGFIDREWIVSRKRNRNLGDFVSAWKKALLNTAPVEDVLPGIVDEWF